MQVTGNPAISEGEFAERGFRSRVTRAERARPVMAKRRQRLRKRCAALAAALALPAMAGATNWGTAAPAAREGGSAAFSHYAPGPTSLSGADYATFATAPQIRSGDDAVGSFPADAASPGPIARAFMSSASWLDRARAEQCLTMAIYYEAATQPDDGQRAVAQVVLNRVAHPSFPHTVCGVVFQGSERSTGCQFTFTCDGSLARKPVPYWWDRARRVADAALSGEVYAPVGLATHYHTLDVHPAWDNAMERVATIGAHVFFRWPGPAGDKAAFHVAYLGGEPVAAPHPRALTPAPADDDPLALARAYVASLPASRGSSKTQIAATTTKAVSAPAPAYSEAIEARGGDALFRGSNLPAGGTLSPELQRSGQWLDRP
jgi:hypothetical protein